MTQAGTASGLEHLKRSQTRAAIVGALGLVALGAGGVASPDQFFHSYLPAFIFVFGLALGSLALLMLQHMTGGAWGLMIRRLLEAGARTLPLVALLFVPIAFGLRHVYVWAVPESVAADAILQQKAPYLNTGFFVARAVLYFILWIGMATALSRWSAAQDAQRTRRDDPRFRLVSGPGLVVYGLTVTFASVDWVMSLDGHWFSTIFGMLFMAGQALAALSFAVAVLAASAGDEPFRDRVNPTHFHDLGKLLFALVMLWAYLAFSQFLIIWAGNLPEEIPWFIERLRGGWQYVAIALVVGHFFLPFLLLLSRDLKRNRPALLAMAMVILAGRFVDVYWLTAPAFPREGFAPHWMDLAALAGIGGLWLAVFFRLLQSRERLPVHDPYFEDAVAHGGH